MSRLAAVLVLCLLSGARVSLAQDSTLDARIAAMVAARWDIAPERVRLAWPAPRPSADIEIKALVSRPSGWWTIVPTNPNDTGRLLGFRAGVIDSVRAARHPLARAVALTDADMMDTVVVRWGRPSQRAASRAQAGWVTRRMIAAGEELRAPGVAPVSPIARHNP